MKAPWHAALLILFLTLPGVAAAGDTQVAGRLTFQQAWELHQKASPALVRLDLDRQTLRKEAEAWFKAYLPSITAQGDLSRSPSPLASSLGKDTEKGEGELWSFRGTLNLSLALNSGLAFSARREALNWELAELEYRSQLQSARLNLKKAWVQYQSQGRNLEILRNSQNLAEARYRITQAQHEKGLRSDLELLAARISSLKDRPAVVKAEADLERRLSALRNLLGLPPDADLDPQPLVMSPPVLSDEVSQAVLLAEAQPEVRKALLRLELARLSRESGTASALGPVIALTGAYNSSLTLDPLVQPDKWREDKWKDSLGLGLSLRVPLDAHIPGSTGALAKEKLAVEEEKAQLAVEEARQKALTDLRSLFLDLRVSASALEVQTLSYGLQEQNYRSTQESYDRGRASLQDLDTARQELLKAGQALESEDMNRLFLLLEWEARLPEGGPGIQSSVR